MLGSVEIFREVNKHLNFLYLLNNSDLNWCDQSTTWKESVQNKSNLKNQSKINKSRAVNQQRKDATESK